jgi:hypothetical protein
LGEQERLHGKMSQMWEIYKKCMPDVASAYDELPMEVLSTNHTLVLVSNTHHVSHHVSLNSRISRYSI